MKRKRLITLLMFFCILAGNAWAGAVYFQKTLIELSTADLTAAPTLTQGADWETVTLGNTNLYKTTVPGGSEECYMFHQNVFWVWFTGDNPINLGHQSWGNDNFNSPQDKEDFDWVVKVTGNIDILSYDRKIDNSHSNDRYFLKHDDDATAWDYTRYGSHIYFKISSGSTMSGTITVTATNKDFNGQPYTCTYTIKINQDIKSRKWDFYSQHLNPVPSSNWNEVTINGNDKLNGYNVAITSSTDPKDIITETDGLRFVAAANQFGYKDPDNTGATPIDDRYVGLHQGATLIIPHETWKNKGHEAGKTHIRIKMGRFGSTGIRLTITNGLDALGNRITGTGTYEIGGSAWWGDKGDNHQRGEYHFIVDNLDNNENDFSITVESGGGTWLKLYSIEVYEYDADNIITENSVLGDVYQLLNNGGTLGADGAAGRYYLHYRGKAESTKILASTITTSGNITTNDANKGFNQLEASSVADFTSPTHTYTSHIGDFGTFGMQIGCYTHQVTIGETKYQYCTDYASRRQSVGYMESKSYPYTWDFTDIYAHAFESNDRMAGFDSGKSEQYYQRSGEHLWASLPDSKFGLRLALDAGHNVMFCGGSQLWYGQTIIPEAAGLAFTPVNYDNAYDYSLSLSADGLTFAQGNRDWWGWRVTVPSVDVNGAIYIHAKKEPVANLYAVKYYIGWEPYMDGEEEKYKPVNNKTTMVSFPSATNNGSGVANIISVTDDEVIYAVYNNHSVNEDITLFFNGLTVNKIAVSTDKKTVNKNGWASESRARVIDPSLTAEMTGQDFRTYIVTGVDANVTHATMQLIGSKTITSNLLGSASSNTKNACLIQRVGGGELAIVNGGFHLFVPDMHYSDELKSEYDTSGNMLKAQLATGTVPASETISENKYINFVFSYRYRDVDPSTGAIIGSAVYEGPQGFYRVAGSGANSSGNQAYLPLLQSIVNLQDWSSASRCVTLTFDEDEGGDVTNIEVIPDIVSQNTVENVYYSLSGQKLNGKPAKGGIYICNGKKVVIK